MINLNGTGSSNLRANGMSEFYTKDILKNKSYSIGDHTYGSPKVLDWNDGTRLEIGKYCSIADNVTFILGGNHRTDWVTTYPFSAIGIWAGASLIKGHPGSKGDLVIGNDVWIGYGATILSGITIGNGAVVAAGAVVVKNVDPYSVVAGNPAKVLKNRFSKSDVQKLQEISWWDWKKAKIEKEIGQLCSQNIKNFISKNYVIKKRGTNV